MTDPMEEELMGTDLMVVDLMEEDLVVVDHGKMDTKI